MWDAADVMRMGKDLFIQHGLTTNRTAMDWFQRYYPEHRVHAVNFRATPTRSTSTRPSCRCAPA